jgi:hypothetical protein
MDLLVLLDIHPLSTQGTPALGQACTKVSKHKSLAQPSLGLGSESHVASPSCVVGSNQILGF